MGVLGKPTLQRRVSLLLLAFLAIVLGLFSWLGIQSLNDSTRRTLDERLSNAKMAAAYLDQNLAHLISDLRDHADFGGFMPQDIQFAAAAEYLREETKSLGLLTEAVFLVGPDGRILVADPSFPNSARAALASADTKISQSISTGKTTVSGLVYEPLTMVPVVFATSPIPGTGGAYIGALSIAVNMNESSLSAIISPITLGNTGYAEIVDGNGVVLARTQPGRAPDRFELSDHPDKFAMLISQDQATVRTCHRCHGTLANPQRSGKDVLAFAPLTNAAWGIALRQSETEAFAITNDLKRRLLLLGVAVAVAAFLLVWIVTQGVVRPVKALTAAAAKVASGDFRVKVPVKGQDEIGQLGVSFSAMAMKLDQTTNELVSRNRELSSLNSIASVVGQSLDLDEVMARSLERVLEVTQTVGGCVLLASRHGDGDSLQEGSRLGTTGSSDCQRLYQHRRCACIEAMHLRQTLLVDDASQCPALGQAGPADKQVAGFVSIPLKSKHQSLGVMNLYFPPGHYFTEQDLKLLDAFGSYVGLAAENAALYQEARQEERLRGHLLDATITAQEDERKRLARELHDEFGQTLTGVIMGIESIEDALPEKESVLSERLARTKMITGRALQDLRKLISGLRSTVLDELGLVAAIRSQAEDQLEAAGIIVHLAVEGMGNRLPPAVETSLFRVAQEAFNNIVKHSHANSVKITLRAENNRVMLMVYDDGTGFDSRSAFTGPKGSSVGILGMRERATLIGGTFTVISEPGSGTHVVVDVPLGNSADRAGEPRGKEEALSG